MFETSVVRARAVAAGGRASLLTISVAAHSMAVIGAVVLSVASTEFPRVAPDEFVRVPEFVPVTVPPPLGSPNAGAARQSAPEQRPVPSPPAQVTAPPEVPETIPEAGGAGAGSASGAAAGGEAGPLGVPWGVVGGVGDLDAPPADVPAEPVEEKVYHPGGEVKVPVLIHRVEPVYPPALAKARLNAVVVVRCVIDKSGRVRDPEVIVPAMPPFNRAVLDAVSRWRYTPGTLRGQAVNTYLELKVAFRVNGR